MTSNSSWFHTKITDSAKRLAQEAINQNQLTNGPHTKQLQDELQGLLGSTHCLYVNSGTSALAMSLIAAGATAESRILTSGVGWVATPQAIQLIGAKPYIVDVQEHTPIIDLTSVNDEYDFLIPVNYNGRQVDLQPLNSFESSPCLIEDSCKSFFSLDYSGSKYSGLNGRFGCFSLGMISIVPGVYGGLITTNSDQDFQKLSSIKWHGATYEQGEESYDYQSFNFKSSNLHAALALGMLQTIDERISRLKTIYAMYEEGLAGLENTYLLGTNVNDGELPLLIDLVSTDRRSHTSKLNSQGVPTCNYHQALATAPGVIPVGPMTNSDYFGSSVYHPPCGPDQSLRTIEQAIQLIRSFG